MEKINRRQLCGRDQGRTGDYFEAVWETTQKLFNNNIEFKMLMFLKRVKMSYTGLHEIIGPLHASLADQT